MFPPNGASYTKTALENYLWGIPSAKRHKVWIVPVLELRAAIDDSGSAKREPYFALAGFISTKENWDRFVNQWQAVLDESPTLSYFKRREAFHRVEQFDGWSEKDAAGRIAKFVHVIQSSVMVRVSRALKRSHYAKYFHNASIMEVDDPYFLLFYSLIYGVVLYQKQYGWKTQIEFVFDQQGKIGRKAREWYDVFCRMAEPLRDYLPAEPRFEDSKKFLPLQAADLYAWNVRRNLFDNKILHTPPSYELPALENMQKIDKVLSLNELAEIKSTAINAERRRPFYK